MENEKELKDFINWINDNKTNTYVDLFWAAEYLDYKKSINSAQEENSNVSDNEKSKEYFCEDKDNSCRFFIPKDSKCDYIHFCIYKQKCE